VDVHYALATAINATRADALVAAYHSHPERFVHGKPKLHVLPHRSLDQQTETLAKTDAVATEIGDPNAIASLI
jgi:putative transposase